MVRNLVLAATIGLTGCAQPEPVIRVDGDIINRAVQHAQAQVDADRPGHDAAPAEETRK